MASETQAVVWPGIMIYPDSKHAIRFLEPRYLEMLDYLDAQGQNNLVIACFKQGWDDDYFANPDLQEIACFAELGNTKKLASGIRKSIIKGIYRVRLLREVNNDRPFREFIYETVEEIPASASEETELRTQLAQLNSTVSENADEIQSARSLSSVVDAVCLILPLDADRKYQLFATLDVADRARETLRYWHELVTDQKRFSLLPPSGSEEHN